MLLVLLAVEGVTILFIRPLISVHVFVGLLLVPPVALKLASTGWRLLSATTQAAAEYVAKGPPQTVLRLLVAPVVVVSTVACSGRASPCSPSIRAAVSLVGLHKVSFVVWLVATGVHVLAYLPRLWNLVSGDLTAASRLPSARLRLGLVTVAVAAGALFAAGSFHLASPWLDWVRNRH